VVIEGVGQAGLVGARVAVDGALGDTGMTVIVLSFKPRDYDAMRSS